MNKVEVICGDALEQLKLLPDQSVQCCVTSPPYWGLRDYGVVGQLGLERSPDEYVEKLVAIFREVKRVLLDDATLWLNLGDCYSRAPEKGGSGPGNKGNIDNGLGEAREAMRSFRSGSARADGVVSSASPRNRNGTPPCGLPEKNLIGIPWRVAFALQADGWCLRSEIIWVKPNPMPESVTDRPTKAHEQIFLLAKNSRYYYDADAIREPAVCNHLPGRGMTDTRTTYGSQNGGNSGLVALRNRLNDQQENDSERNKRSVWTVPTAPYAEAHFATFPPDLIKPCIMAGCPVGGTVLDPFGGSGTTGMVALELGRSAILIELNPKYVELIRQRINITPGLPLA